MGLYDLRWNSEVLSWHPLELALMSLSPVDQANDDLMKLLNDSLWDLTGFRTKDIIEHGQQL